MVMTEGQVFRCQNRDCGCEVRVLRTSLEGRANPRCGCGAEMKKTYHKPALRALKAGLDLVAANTNKS